MKTSKNRSMVISLIGRPNVGKSSIFNRLMKKGNRAITHDQPGVTRDRHYGIATFSDLSNERDCDAILVDTGGFYPEKVDEKAQDAGNEFNHFFNIMTDHAHLAVEESDLVLFVVDIREGVLPFDEGIANYIRSQKKDFWLVINKYDSDKQMGEEGQFYSLGIEPDEMFVVSAAHGIGMQNLREKLHERMLGFSNAAEASTPELQLGVTPREKVVARLALIGAPNAGKSTLLNRLVGANRALVSDIPGTTVDPIEGFFDLYFGETALELDENTPEIGNNSLILKEYEHFRKNNANVFERMEDAYGEQEGSFQNISEADLVNDESLETIYDQVFEESEVEEIEEAPAGSFWRSLHIVDTAGIRKKRSIDGQIESQSVFRSLRCITESDIVVYLVDATKGIAHQDRRLLDIALEKGKSVIICLNKIDLLKDQLKTHRERTDWLLDLRAKIPWLAYCDIIPISAKEGKYIKQLKKSLVDTIMVRRRKIPTGALNRYVFNLVENNPIMIQKSRGVRFRVKYASMVKSSPPTILLFSNRSKGIPDNFRRYLQNGIRREFEMVNTPVHLIFRTGTDLEKRKQKKSTN